MSTIPGDHRTPPPLKSASYLKVPGQTPSGNPVSPRMSNRLTETAKKYSKPSLRSTLQRNSTENKRVSYDFD